MIVLTEITSKFPKPIIFRILVFSGFRPFWHLKLSKITSGPGAAPGRPGGAPGGPGPVLEVLEVVLGVHALKILL